MRQVRRKIGDLVGIELLRGRAQLLAVHGGDQRLADRIGNLDQDLAVTLRLDQVPYQQALLDRQGFQNVGDVCRMQAIQLVSQFGEVLLVHQGVEQGVAVFARQFLPMNDLFQQGVLVQQRFHLLEVFLHILGVVMFLVGIGHRVCPVNRALL